MWMVFCYFNQVDGKSIYSVKLSYTGFVDTYAFKFNSTTIAAFYFPLVSTSYRDTIYTLLSATVDTAKGTVAGIVQWSDNAGTLEDVGCATVTSDTGVTPAYMDGAGIPTYSRSTTHPSNGYYILPNVTPGAYTLTATTDGKRAQCRYSGRSCKLHCYAEHHV